MKLTLKRINDKFAFETTNETGATVITDASPEIGGENKGLRPMELLASGLASCASIDILLILEKQRQIITDYSVEINAVRKTTVPAIFDQIELKLVFFGEINEKKAEKAAELTFSKYCSVSKILEKTCTINYTLSINPAS